MKLIIQPKSLPRFLFSVLLLINGLGASGQAIRFLEPDLQLAGLTAGQTQPITFQLTNGTDTAIKIQSADASCECTTLKQAPAEIPAHGLGEFQWIFDSSRSTGLVSQTVTVQIAGGPTVQGQFSTSVSATSPSPGNAGSFRPRGVYVHDPSTIAGCGTEHWFFSTGMGIPSHHSTTFTNWLSGPRVFHQMPAWITNAVPGNQGVFWAPDVIQQGDRYLLYYAASTWGKRVSAIGLATNPTLDPAAPNFHWTDAGPVFCTTLNDDFNAIDPSVFRDDDGSLWLAFGSYWSGIKLFQLDPATGLRIAPASPIYSLARHHEGDDTSIEAACLTRHGQYYYLFVNWFACCRGTNSTYEIRIGRSEKVTGPFVDSAGKNMLANGGDIFLHSQGRFIGPGHAGIYQENGTNWFSFHFYDGDRHGLASIGVRPLVWATNGWPALVTAKP